MRKHTFLAIVCTGLLLFSAATVSAQYKVGDWIELQAAHPKGVPLHRQAKSSMKGRVPDGAKAKILKLAKNGHWLKIHLEDGKEGWIIETYVGNEIILLCAAFTGVVGVLIIVLQIQITLKRIKIKIKKGKYPGKEFISIAGVLVGAIFLLTPGFITDFLGFLLFIPLFRNKIGTFITKKMESRLKDIYEYLKLYEM